ncbi:MAG: hypothetical protein ACOC2N_03200 [Spirochaetota bacterium]
MTNNTPILLVVFMSVVMQEGCQPTSWVRTPHLRRIRREGLTLWLHSSEIDAMSRPGPIHIRSGGPGRLPELSPEIYQSMGELGIFAMLEAFYVQLLGGPPLYSEQYGSPMMRRRHFPFENDESARSAWVACFYRVLERSGESGFPPIISRRSARGSKDSRVGWSARLPRTTNRENSFQKLIYSLVSQS